MEDFIKAVVEEYGVFAGLLVAVIVLYNKYIHEQWCARIRDKDEELKRVIDERNRLQEIVLKKRLTSGEKDV